MQFNRFFYNYVREYDFFLTGYMDDCTIISHVFMFRPDNGP